MLAGELTEEYKLMPEEIESELLTGTQKIEIEIKRTILLEKFKNNLKTVPNSYITAVIITVMLLFFTLNDPQGFLNTIKSINMFIFENFGKFYLWFVLLTLIAFVAVGFSPLGKIRIGGKHAKSEHSFFSWFSMLFCAGMGIGLLFWGSAEPLFFFMDPPIEGSATAAQKEIMAFKLSFLHWGLHPWAIYGFTTLAICFFSMNLKKGMFFSSFISKKLNSDNIAGKITKAIVDNIITLAILFGIVASFGMGVLQFEGGLESFLGMKKSIGLEVLIIIGVTVCYMISTLRGLNKGIKILSNISMVLCFVLLTAVIFILPVQEYLNVLLTAAPSYLYNIVDMSTGNLQYNNPYFLQEWTTKYWTWWIAWAPFVGIFTTLVSKGRTVRELVFSMLLAPTLFSIVWFSVFGKAAIMLQTDTAFMGAAVNYDNANTILFQLIKTLFSSPIFNMLALLLVSIFFINSADSATYTLAALTNTDKNAVQINSKEDIEIKTPPLFMQVSWGVTFSILTAIFLFIGGLEILQYITLIAVLPFSFLLAFIFIRLLVDMTKYYRQMYRNER